MSTSDDVLSSAVHTSAVQTPTLATRTRQCPIIEAGGSLLPHGEAVNQCHQNGNVNVKGWQGGVQAPVLYA